MNALIAPPSPILAALIIVVAIGLLGLYLVFGGDA